MLLITAIDNFSGVDQPFIVELDKLPMDRRKGVKGFAFYTWWLL